MATQLKSKDQQLVEDIKLLQAIRAQKAKRQAATAEPEQESSSAHSFVETVGDGFNATGKALDTTGAPARALLASAAKHLGMTGGKDLYTSEELSDAYDPTNIKQFPTSAELMKRAGVKEGDNFSDTMPSLYDSRDGKSMFDAIRPSRGGMFDPSTRATGGALADMLFDFANLFGGAGVVKQAGAKGVGAVLKGTGKKILSRDMLQGIKDAAAVGANFPSVALAGLGGRRYRAGLAPITRAAVAGGKKAEDFTETMYKNGIRGSALDIEEQAAHISRGLNDDAGKVLAKADEAGASVDTNKIVEETFGKIIRTVDDETGAVTRTFEFEGALKKALDDDKIGLADAEKMLTHAEELFSRGTVKAQNATNLKSRVREELPARVWGNLPNKGADNILGKALGQKFQGAVEDAVGLATKNGDELKRLNAENGMFLTTQKKMSGRATQEFNQSSKGGSPLTAAAFTGAGAMIAPIGAAVGGGAYAAKKALDAARTTAGKTRMGYWARKHAEKKVSGKINTITGRAATKALLGGKNKPEKEDE